MIAFFVHILVFVFGAVVGSFLNVVAYRLPRKISLIKLGSHCPHCQIPIPWKYKIPIVSYFVLKGRCWNCWAEISWHYPLVETLSGVVALALFWQFGLTPAFMFYLIFAFGLILISIIDLQEMIIPNEILITLIILGVGINVLFHVQSWGNALWGMSIASVSMLAIGLLGKLMFKQDALGMGDIKLAGVAGFYLGGNMIIYAIFFSFLVAFIAIILMILLSRIQRRDTIPFGPFMSIAMLSFVLWGQAIIQWYWGLFS